MPTTQFYRDCRMVVLLLWYFGQSIAAQGVQSLLLAATTAVAKSIRSEVLRITKASDTNDNDDTKSTVYSTMSSY